MQENKKGRTIVWTERPILFWKHLASEHFIHSFGLFGEKSAQALAALLS